VQPYYQRDGITIYNATWQKVRATLPPCDLAVVDPPLTVPDEGNVVKFLFDARIWHQLTKRATVLILTNPVNGYFRIPYVWGGMIALPEFIEQENLAVTPTVYHPHSRPMAPIQELIAMHHTGGLILDPFMGGGTTLVAAANLGYPAIGVESEKKYCALAAQRLDQVLSLR
jgi:DNA modification methylase